MSQTVCGELLSAFRARQMHSNNPALRECKVRMLELDLTLTDVAKELDISISYLSQILSGQRAGVNYMGKLYEVLEKQNDQTNT